MQMAQTETKRGGMSDRTLNRLIIGAIVALVVIIPLVGIVYFFDRHTDPGPSINQRAVTAAEEAVRANPNDITARTALATGYLQAERYQDAVAQYTEVLKAVPEHHGALLGLGNAYFAMGDTANAEKTFQKLIDIAITGETASSDPQLEEALFRMAQIQYDQGKYDAVIKSLNSALVIDRTDADAMNLLGAADVKAGKPKDAIVPLTKAITFVPTGWCDPYQHLGEAYAALGDADGAAYANGMVAFCQGQPEVAAKALTPLADGTYAVVAMLGLGQIAEQAGDVATATSWYSKVLEKDPQNSNAIFGIQRMTTGASADPHAGLPASSAAPDASPSTGANP